MISEIVITNYKSILYQRFTLARINVFFGRSGCGKTNLLEAVGMAAAAHDGDSDTGGLLKRGIRVTKPSLTFHASIGKEKKKEIEIAWCERNGSKKAKLVCESRDDQVAAWKDISWYDPAYIARVNDLIDYISNGSFDERYPFADKTKNMVLNAAFRGSRNFRDYQIFNALTEDQIVELLMDSTPPAFFAMDNIETLLTPEICSNVINNITPLAARQNKQVLITTSQPAIIRGMNLDDPLLKLFLMERREDGQTTLKEITDIPLIFQ